MKLYYSPGACSLSTNIVLREAGLPFTLERVDKSREQTESGENFRAINPKGYVPTLKLDNGEVLTEANVMAQYIADQRPEKRLAPAAGSFERIRLQELLNFIATEIHKNYSPLFNPATPDATREMFKSRLAQRYGYLENHVLADGRPYLMGEQFTIADAYLFVVTNWARLVHFDLAAFPKVVAHSARIAERETVKDAMKSEGLLQ
jgi:glutathione S-transferase